MNVEGGRTFCSDWSSVKMCVVVETRGRGLFHCTAGVMSARGILENPAMFAGHPSTPPSCIQDWVDTTLTHGLSHTLFHHHLIHMLERVTTRVEKRVFNTLPSIPAVLDYLRTHYGIT